MASQITVPALGDMITEDEERLAISTAASEITSLDTRVSTADSSATSLTTRVSTEESTRTSADTSLTTRVSTEESTRASADTSLTTRVSTEESTRASADTSLDTRIDTFELLLSLHQFREMSSGGDVGDAAANGGLLASDTTPIMRGDGNKSQEISWATGNTDIIGTQQALPVGFDGTQDATVDLWVYSGTTNAATFTVETSWDAGAIVTDTATDGSPSATIHKITATIAAADIPNTARFVTILLTPAAHATDAIQLVAASVNVKKS